MDGGKRGREIYEDDDAGFDLDQNAGEVSDDYDKAPEGSEAAECNEDEDEGEGGETESEDDNPEATKRYWEMKSKAERSGKVILTICVMFRIVTCDALPIAAEKEKLCHSRLAAMLSK